MTGYTYNHSYRAFAIKAHVLRTTYLRRLDSDYLKHKFIDLFIILLFKFNLILRYWHNFNIIKIHFSHCLMFLFSSSVVLVILH